MPVSGSNAPPPQFAPPNTPGRKRFLRLTADVHRTVLLLELIGACLRSSGGEVDQVSSTLPCNVKAGGFVGNSCVGDGVAGNRGLRDGTLLDRPDGLPVQWSNEREAPFRHLITDLIDRPSRDIGQHGCRDVVVPQAVMIGLEVPHALAGPGLTDERFGEQIVAEAIAAVVLAGRAWAAGDAIELGIVGDAGPDVRLPAYWPTR